MAFSIGSLFHSIGSALHNFFTKNGGAIQNGLSEALAAAAVAGSVASVFEPANADGSANAIVAEIGKIASGLIIVQNGVSAASTATDLNGHAAALAGIVTGLVTSGDIGIKNAQTQAAIGVMATKVQSVVGVLETAANVAPKA